MRNSPCVTLVLAKYSVAMSCLRSPTRQSITGIPGFGITSNATTETTGHPHQVGVIQGVIGPSQLPPPGAEPSGSMCHTEITRQNDSVEAIVATGEEILLKVSESVRHSGANVSPYSSPCNYTPADS